MNIKGMWVEVDMVHITRTYAGLLEGPHPPAQEWIERQLASAKKLQDRGGPDECVPHLLPPEGSGKVLPEYMIQVVLMGPEKDSDADGGMVHLLYFSDSYEVDLEKLFERFTWSDVVTDFWL